MSADESLLREMVREILRDLVTPAGHEPVGEPPAGSPGQGVDVVTVADQADLDSAIRRMSADASARSAFDRGALRFVYAGPEGDAVRPTTAPADQPTRRVDRGALTERIVNDAARAGSRIEIARGVVVTPLARDRARALGVSIHQDRQE